MPLREVRNPGTNRHRQIAACGQLLQGQGSTDYYVLAPETATRHTLAQIMSLPLESGPRARAGQRALVQTVRHAGRGGGAVQCRCEVVTVDG
ncbi:hypothetical protein FJTKL_01677 [Diaporthe vaccinii]|uniref:Uncharacterized protein n=1 Tax=Diaporthe vaccinii TaxID=105482 RepID=A0ABR4DZX8_9PEZI